MPKYSNYYLDLRAMESIDPKLSDRIFMMYDNLIMDGDIHDKESTFQTLYQSGYLKDAREEKIKAVIGD